MSESARKKFSVSFSLKDSQEVELLEWIKGKTFSTYVKQLIFLDMIGSRESREPVQSKKTDTKKPDIPDDAVGGFV